MCCKREVLLGTALVVTATTTFDLKSRHFLISTSHLTTINTMQSNVVTWKDTTNKGLFDYISIFIYIVKMAM